MVFMNTTFTPENKLLNTVFEIDEVNSLLENKNYTSILNNKDLFWMTFCKALLQNNNLNFSKNFFSFKEKNVIIFQRNNNTLEKMQIFLDKIRQSLLKGFEKKVPLTISLSPKKNGHVIVEDSNSNYAFYTRCIKPALFDLVKFYNATLTIERISSSKKPKVGSSSEKGEQETIEKWLIDWNPN
jgi:hypothetical protein